MLKNAREKADGCRKKRKDTGEKAEGCCEGERKSVKYQLSQQPLAYMQADCEVQDNEGEIDEGKYRTAQKNHLFGFREKSYKGRYLPCADP